MVAITRLRQIRQILKEAYASEQPVPYWRQSRHNDDQRRRKADNDDGDHGEFQQNFKTQCVGLIE